ncbi:MAG: hypothetical protein K2H67_00785 [Treponemataceae bacterium]|nr:hypothetical protein [Treponemataceae bacterium]
MPAGSTLADGSEQESRFRMERDRLVAETADPLGNVSVQETSLRMSS